MNALKHLLITRIIFVRQTYEYPKRMRRNEEQCRVPSQEHKREQLVDLLARNIHLGHGGDAAWRCVIWTR